MNVNGGTVSSGLARLVAALVLLSAAVGSAAEPGAVVPSRGCPLRFDQETTGLPSACLFVGGFQGAPDQQVMAAFAGDGSALVVALRRRDAKPLLYLPAAVESPTSGRLQSWERELEPSAATDLGQVTLEDGGRRLRLRTASADGPREYVGHFATMMDAPESAIAQR